MITGSSLPPVPRPKVHDAALRLRLLECAGATLSTRGLAALSLRNAPEVHLLSADQLNTYDVLVADDVVFTKGAYDAFVAGPSTGKSVKAVATSEEEEAAK